MDTVYKSDNELHSDAQKLHDVSKQHYHQDIKNIDNRIATKLLAEAINKNTEALYKINDTLKELLKSNN